MYDVRQFSFFPPRICICCFQSHYFLNRAVFCDRTSRSNFLVSVNKYLEAKSHKLSVVMGFNVRFEGDEVPERRYLLSENGS